MKAFWITFSILIVFVLCFLVLPNIFNSREEQEFNRELRIQKSVDQYRIDKLGDSITIKPSNYYSHRSFIHSFLLGNANRKAWEVPVKMKVFDVEKVRGGLSCIESGGGQQTTSLDFMDSAGCVYSLRSVNKDNLGLISGFWRKTLIRPLLREQGVTIMPYAVMTMPPIYEAVGLPPIYPELYFVPYDTALTRSCLDNIAGMVAIMEVESDEMQRCPTWPNNMRVLGDTEDMREFQKIRKLPIDTYHYAKMRLLDVVVGDWDRHDGNCAWAIASGGTDSIIRAIPMDRDAAYFRMNGFIPSMVKEMIDKFQSFTPEIDDLEGYVQNSMERDKQILGSFSDEQWIKAAKELRNELSDDVLREAVNRFPDELPDDITKHIYQTLRARRNNLPGIARQFSLVVS